MKTNKEYPATHSMDTAWYIVDDDGNIGIMDYEENGPVPYEIEQTCPEELIWGHWEDWYNNKITQFALTKEQVMELLEKPNKPEDEELWFDCVVKIEPEKLGRFLELCKNEDIGKNGLVCVSKELNLYTFDATMCRIESGNNISVCGTLKTILDERIILEVYRIKYLEVGYDYIEKGDVKDKTFDSIPYYMFHEAWDFRRLPIKCSTPKNPVKINQIPDDFKSRIHHIPGSFNKLKTFQVAEFVPCDVTVWHNEELAQIDGQDYKLLPDSYGNESYIAIGHEIKEGTKMKYSIEEVKKLVEQGEAKMKVLK